MQNVTQKKSGSHYETGHRYETNWVTARQIPEQRCAKIQNIYMAQENLTFYYG